MRYFFYLSCCVVFFMGCQTTAPPFLQLPDIAGSVHRHFGTCTPDAGVLGLKVSGHPLPRAQLEWLVEGTPAADSQQIWIDMIDDFGLEIARLRLSRSESEISSSKINFAAVQVTKDGHITYQGHKTGLKLSELACIIQGVFPQIWYDRIYAKKDRSYLSWDESRKIRLDFDSRRACAQMHWRRMWFWKSKLDICRDEFQVHIKVHDIELALRRK